MNDYDAMLVRKRQNLVRDRISVIPEVPNLPRILIHQIRVLDGPGFRMIEFGFRHGEKPYLSVSEGLQRGAGDGFQA